MSASSSPHIGSAALDAVTSRKRDRPPALTLESSDPKAVSDGEVRYHQPNGKMDSSTRQVYKACCFPCHEDILTSIFKQPRLHVSATERPSQAVESESEVPRSVSATSSLAYYFSNPSREDSPALPLINEALASTTPETRLISGPFTPGRDPAGIDRQGLIGVGELATPRWARGPRYGHNEDEKEEDDEDVDEENELIIGDDEKDGPDSPWTIEAVNSESDEKDEVFSRLPLYLLFY
jgi:dual specificity tyrosine-phosphorylation-regulated kinase 2/3/4